MRVHQDTPNLFWIETGKVLIVFVVSNMYMYLDMG